jgi:hypothetical protein
MDAGLDVAAAAMIHKHITIIINKRRQQQRRRRRWPPPLSSHLRLDHRHHWSSHTGFSYAADALSQGQRGVRGDMDM